MSIFTSTFTNTHLPMLRFLYCGLVLCFTLSVQAAIHPGNAVAEPTTTALTLDDIRDLSQKELTEKMGRRLSFKEAIAVRIVRGKLRRADRRAQKGRTKGGYDLAGKAQSYGLITIVSFFLSGILPFLFSRSGRVCDNRYRPGGKREATLPGLGRHKVPASSLGYVDGHSNIEPSRLSAYRLGNPVICAIPT